jgi:hypothetical protein
MGAPGSLRDQLQEAIRSSITLNDCLERVLPTPLRHLPGEVRHGKVSAAPVPWYSGAAWLIFDLHAKSRSMENELRELAGHAQRTRGGSTGNTYKALESIMAVSWSVEDEIVKECNIWLQSWCGRAYIALGLKDEPRRLPRQPGQKDPSCPFCNERTLRFWAYTGVVRCINSECCINPESTEPVKAQARMEWSTVANDFVLVWNDNSVGVPV